MNNWKELKSSELYQRVDEVLHYTWDPLGASDFPDARDEYQSYVLVVFNLVHSNKSIKEISDYLLNIEKKNMGMPGIKERAVEVAKILIHYKEILDKKSNQ